MVAVAAAVAAVAAVATAVAAVATAVAAVAAVEGAGAAQGWWRGAEGRARQRGTWHRRRRGNLGYGSGRHRAAPLAGHSRGRVMARGRGPGRRWGTRVCPGCKYVGWRAPGWAWPAPSRQQWPRGRSLVSAARDTCECEGGGAAGAECEGGGVAGAGTATGIAGAASAGTAMGADEVGAVGVFLKPLGPSPGPQCVGVPMRDTGAAQVAPSVKLYDARHRA